MTSLICLYFILNEINSALMFQNLKVVFVMGVFQLGLPYMLYAFAAKKNRAIDSVMTSAVEMVLNPIWVFMLYKEMPTFYGTIGIGLIGLGILKQYLCNYNVQPKNLK